MYLINRAINLLQAEEHEGDILIETKLKSITTALTSCGSKNKITQEINKKSHKVKIGIHTIKEDDKTVPRWDDFLQQDNIEELSSRSVRRKLMDEASIKWQSRWDTAQENRHTYKYLPNIGKNLDSKELD